MSSYADPAPAMPLQRKRSSFGMIKNRMSSKGSLAGGLDVAYEAELGALKKTISELERGNRLTKRRLLEMHHLHHTLEREADELRREVAFLRAKARSDVQPQQEGENAAVSVPPTGGEAELRDETFGNTEFGVSRGLKGRNVGDDGETTSMADLARPQNIYAELHRHMVDSDLVSAGILVEHASAAKMALGQITAELWNARTEVEELKALVEACERQQLSADVDELLSSLGITEESPPLPPLPPVVIDRILGFLLASHARPAKLEEAVGAAADRGFGDFVATVLRARRRGLSVGGEIAGAEGNSEGEAGADESQGSGDAQDSGKADFDPYKGSKERIRKEFAIYDEDGNGVMTPDEVRKVSAAMGYNLTEKDLVDIFNRVDKDGDGYLNVDEFITVLLVPPSEKQIMRAFAASDKDKKGYLTPAEVRDVMKRVGCRLHPEEVTNAIAAADIDGDGSIDYSELLKTMLDDWAFRSWVTFLGEVHPRLRERRARAREDGAVVESVRVGKARRQLREHRKFIQQREESLGHALAAYEDVHREVARLIGRHLVEDEQEFDDVFKRICYDEGGNLDKLHDEIMRLANKDKLQGPVAVGDIVTCVCDRAILSDKHPKQHQYAAPDNGREQRPEGGHEGTSSTMDVEGGSGTTSSGGNDQSVGVSVQVLARVDAVGAGGASLDLSLWMEVETEDYGYESGFDTTQPRKVSGVPRWRVAKPVDVRQPLVSTSTMSLTTGLAAVGEERSPTSVKALTGVFAHAEATYELLMAHGKDIVEQVRETCIDRSIDPSAHSVSLQSSGLRSIKDAAERVLEDHQGRYDELTGVAQLTMVCETCWTMVLVLEVLRLHPWLKVLAIENTMVPGADVTAEGGFRKVVVSIVVKETGHVAELHLIHSAFFSALKEAGGGGASSLRVAKVLGLLDKRSLEHWGTPGDLVLERVASGVIRVLDVTEHAVYDEEHLADITSALSTRSCCLTILSLASMSGFLNGHPIDELLSEAVVDQLAPRLVTLDLSGNGLCGTPPLRLWNSMSRLEHLRLARNKLEGTLPADVGKLVRLVTFDVSDNHFSGEIPDVFDKTPELESLLLSTNRFQGAFPTSVVGCQRLRVFQLEDFWVDGAIPEEINRLTLLERLSLDSIDLAGFMLPFQAYSRVQHISLRGCLLVGRVPGGLRFLERVEHIDISENAIDGPIPSFLMHLTRLRVFRAADPTEGSGLTGVVPEFISNLVGLEELVLRGNKISGELPASITECTALRVLDMRENRLEGKLPADISKLSDLRRLDLAHNHLEGTIPKGLTRCNRLYEIQLQGQALEGVVEFRHLAHTKLERLKELRL